MFSNRTWGVLVFLASGLLQGAEINGQLDIARITTPAAPPTNFSRISVNVTTGAISCLNADSTTCFAVNMSGAAAPTLPAATTYYTIGASSGNSRDLNIAYAGTSFFTNARIDGTPASPTAVQSGEQLGGYNAFGYNGTALVGAGRDVCDSCQSNMDRECTGYVCAGADDAEWNHYGGCFHALGSIGRRNTAVNCDGR